MPAKKTTKKAAKKAATKSVKKTATKAAKKTTATKAPKKAAKKAAKKTTKAAAQPKPAPTFEEIAVAAFLKHMNRKAQGLPDDPTADWLEAERELRG